MKIIFLIALVFISIIIYAGINHDTGIINTTRLNGEGCTCHNQYFNDSVHVWIEGPDSILVSDTVAYKIFLSGGPAVKGGFNVAVRFGVLKSDDSTTYVSFNELTHSFPFEFKEDTIFWNFSYVTPDSSTIDTIYSVANSVDGNGNPTNDEWNFGENFAVHIIDIPTNSQDLKIQPAKYVLEQNFPNPFNPNTIISYRLPFQSHVSLKVYDIIGNEIATLVNEEKSIGEYEVEFNASGLSSGIYFYRMETKNFAASKKMLFLK